MAAISIEGLSKYYGSARVRALDGIDLAVADGEVMALLGPSGCGKTTTLQLLAGFLTPEEGRIVVGDRVLSSPGFAVVPERRNMSLIFQSYAVWPHKTVFENVAFAQQLRKHTKEAVRARVAEVLDIVQLGPFAQRYPAELSGGQQQRVALARAIAVKPEILLLDEPLSNLDASLREEMRFEIRQLHDQTGLTMVYVTHDQAEAMVTADHIALMDHGRVAQVGTPEELYERPASAFVANFIGRTNMLEGKLNAAGVVDCSGVALRVADDGGHVPGARVIVCIRPHQLTIGTRASAENALPGIITRQVYLGEARDYLIDADCGTQLRVSAGALPRYSVGDRVIVTFPPDAARVVAQ